MLRRACFLPETLYTSLSYQPGLELIEWRLSSIRGETARLS
jgi:hypothetical protein